MSVVHKTIQLSTFVVMKKIIKKEMKGQVLHNLNTLNVQLTAGEIDKIDRVFQL